MAYVGRGIDKVSNIEVLDAITFTDSAGPYNLLKDTVAFVPTSVNALVISIDGVVQSPDSYTTSAATITFDSVMAAASTNNFIYQIGTGVITSPSDASVTVAKLATDAVETVKIKDLNVTAGKLAANAAETAKIKDLNVTAGKLANTLDLSTKTVTLPTSAIPYPTYTSITPSMTTNDATTFTIVGTNFGASGIPAVEFQNATGGITAATSVVRDSATQLTAVATLAVDGTYYIRIELNSGLAVRSSSADLTISDEPVWTTGSGTLGTIAGDFSGTVATVAATGDTVTYSEVSGTGLTGAGNANCSLNSSTGVITTTDFGGSSTTPTTYNFTIRATDAQAQTSDRAFSLTSSFTYTCDFLVIAGGGGGPGYYYGGGGGAGGYRASWNSEASGGGGSSETALQLTESTVYTVTVGDGGAGGIPSAGDDIGEKGEDSSISGSDITDITSEGGGRGWRSGFAITDSNGGSGGGAYSDGTPLTGGSGTANQGYAGGDSTSGGSTGNTGGGGGAGQVGESTTTSDNGGDGGNGVVSTITGASVTRGGGGAGGAYNGTAGTGGTGGGGNGAENWSSTQATAGTANTGGGGGAASHASNTPNGGAGGKGVVILRMATSDYTGTTTGSPTETTDGSDTILVFNADGTYTG